MAWLAIINPVAGALLRRGGAEVLVDRLERELGLDCLVCRSPGEAEDLAREAAAYSGLVAVGGDGTLAQVINGMQADRQRLALLPAGTGNGLARALGLRPMRGAAGGADLSQLRAALAQAASATTGIDLMGLRFRAGDDQPWTRRLAIGTTALGYAAQVVALARGPLAGLSRRLPSGLCYPLGATLQAFRQPSFELRLSRNDRPLALCRVTNLMVHGCAFAGNFRAFPKARLDDGLMELLVAHARPLAQLRHNFAVLRESHGFATAEPAPVTRVSLRSDRPLTLMLDGELLPGQRAVEWDSLPRALAMALPPGSLTRLQESGEPGSLRF